MLGPALLAVGCSVAPTAPVPVEDRAGRPVERPAPEVTRAATPAPAEADREEVAVESREVPPAAVSSSPAVVALLQQSRQAADRGDLDRSEVHLERAIRIESRNPMIWHRLALIKLYRRQYAEAVAMAERSNALAVGRVTLKRDNWRLIAQAEDARGRAGAAAQAAARARELEP